jgi:hypothetical protein
MESAYLNTTPIPADVLFSPDTRRGSMSASIDVERQPDGSYLARDNETGETATGPSRELAVVALGLILLGSEALDIGDEELREALATLTEMLAEHEIDVEDLLDPPALSADSQARVEQSERDFEEGRYKSLEEV